MNKKIVIVVVVALSGAVLFFGYSEFQKKKERVYQATVTGLRFGKAYGKTSADKDCVNGLKLLYSKCNDIECELSANGFITGCMETSTATDYCDTLPSPDDARLAIEWVNHTCSDLGLQNTVCPKYTHKMVDVCFERRTGKKRGLDEKFKDGFERGLIEQKT